MKKLLIVVLICLNFVNVLRFSYLLKASKKAFLSILTTLSLRTPAVLSNFQFFPDSGRRSDQFKKLESESDSAWKMLFETLFTCQIPLRHQLAIAITKHLWALYICGTLCINYREYILRWRKKTVIEYTWNC